MPQKRLWLNQQSTTINNCIKSCSFYHFFKLLFIIILLWLLFSCFHTLKLNWSCSRTTSKRSTDPYRTFILQFDTTCDWKSIILFVAFHSYNDKIYVNWAPNAARWDKQNNNNAQSISKNYEEFMNFFEMNSSVPESLLQLPQLNINLNFSVLFHSFIQKNTNGAKKNM